MCCSSQSFPGVKLTKTLFVVGVLLLNSQLFAQLSHESAASATVPASSEGFGATIFWVGAAILACGAAVGGIVLARKLQQQKALVAAGGAPAPEARKAFSLPSSNGNGNGSRNLKLNGRPAKSSKLFNHNNHANGNSAKKRRMFNYHKFYTEMVLQGPSPTSVADNTYNPYYGYGYEGYYAQYEPPRINNNGNGHVNGNGHLNGHDNHAADSSTESIGAAGAQASLLANQKSLIEQQERLIQEQARLIEEKSRLIAEKNQLLDRQSQMLDNNLV